MKCQIVVGKCLQQGEREAHIPFIFLSFISPKVLSFPEKVYLLPLFTSPWQLETFSCAYMHVCMLACVLNVL